VNRLGSSVTDTMPAMSVMALAALNVLFMYWSYEYGSVHVRAGDVSSHTSDGYQISGKVPASR